MSLTCTGSSCPMPPSTRVDTISTDSGSGAFKTRRVEKQDVKSWWEHDIKVQITFCENVGRQELDKSKEVLGRHLNGSSYGAGRGYHLSNPVKLGDHVVEVSVTNKGKTAPADVEKQLSSGVKGFMDSLRLWKVDSAKYDFSSAEKQEVKKYDVWDGVDRMVP